jgi:multidrug efflux pump subunit AcrA (membrane-fusion protein)
MVALAAVASVALHIPETVSSPFVLEPVRGVDPVRATRSGIVAKVYAAEGHEVAKGAPLFLLHSSPVGDRSAELQALGAQLRGAGESLVNAKMEYDSQIRADAEEGRKLQERISSLTRTIDLKKKELVLANEILKKYKAGYEQELIGFVEYAARQSGVGRVAVELEEFEKEHKESRAALEKLRHEAEARSVKYRELERRLKEETAKTEIRIAVLRKELKHSQSNELSVLAPCSGTLLRQQVKAAEAFVNEGDLLSELACAGEKLQAELMVPQSGAARLRIGQGVKLLYDAFPFGRYGVRYGTVRWVSPASVSSDNGRGFHALADIEDEAIMVDGQPRPLRAGMRGTAQIVLGRRSLISYAFEPLRQLKESFAEPPPRPTKEQQP